MKQAVRKLTPDWLLSSYHWLWAALSTVWFGFPSEKMTVIGITGTDGKTTTANLIADLLTAAGHKVGLATTINFRIGDKEWPNLTKQGMQGRFRNQQLLKRMVKAGCQYAVVETTSEGIKQFRHIGINYDIAVFTNLTPEHIESHGSFEKYKEAKGKLFQKTAQSCKVDSKKYAIFNGDDEHVDYFLQFDCEHNIIYSLDKPVKKYLPSIWAKDLKLTPTGTSFELFYNDGQTESLGVVQTQLVGKFNVYNSLAAIAVALSQKIEPTKIINDLANVSPVAGRMETVDAGQPFTVIVDYAHAPNALKSVYQTVKPFLRGKLWSVLGSQGGGRDKQKRPVLGKLAGQYADYVVVTNEDPYDEPPQQIIDEVFAGVIEAGKEENKSSWRFAERHDALKHVLSNARPGDIVLVTGKGAEQIMMGPKGKRTEWDDRIEIKKILQK